MGWEFASLTPSQLMLMLLVWGPLFENHSDLDLLEAVLGLADSTPDGMSPWGELPSAGGAGTSEAVVHWSARGSLALEPSLLVLCTQTRGVAFGGR